MNLTDFPAWRTDGQESPNLGCMILLKSTPGNIVFRDAPNSIVSGHDERVDFGKCRDEVAAFQRDSAGVSDVGVNDHDIGRDRAYLFDGAYRMKVFPTNHLESLRPEMLFVGLLLRHVQFAETINDFDVRRFQGCKFLLVKMAVCGTPAFDKSPSR